MHIGIFISTLEKVQIEAMRIILDGTKLNPLPEDRILKLINRRLSNRYIQLYKEYNYLTASVV